MDGNLANKSVVVTGATSGIGLALAEIFASQGALMIGVGRSEQHCRQAEEHLRQANPNARLVYCLADLSEQRQVRTLVREVEEKLAENGFDHLDGLVNNAGTVTYWLTLTSEGFEMQWAVNHLAPFLLTHELLPLLQAAEYARVVTVSSASHYRTRINWEDVQLRRHYNVLRAYRQSKLANVLFTAELNRRLGVGSRVKAFAADPGLVKTAIGVKGTPGWVGWIWKWRASSGISPEETAQGIAYLINEPTIQESPDIYWRHAQPKAPDPYALDEEVARRLWAISERMCGILQEGRL